ncbi:MAG: glucose-phosphate thymidylyltransferase [Patescibacteria group bacterium]|nr:glucose-phosphate thymidylyltransferase [Patescibacteria group bacterium]
MKGILLAGGTGSRLRPTSLLINKSMLPVYNKPSIYYSLELMKEVGIKEVCVIAENNYMDDLKYILGSGMDFGLKLHYENDTPVKKGPASAIYYGKHFAQGENVLVVFADGNFDVDISEEVKNFEDGALIFTYPVKDATRFGIVELGDDGQVISIEEKPENPKSNLACTGMAIYDKHLFEYIEQITPGLNGEYYTVDVDKIYLSQNKLRVKVLEGYWQDVGTFDGLLKAGNYWYKKVHGSPIS